ncbi:hypothetical protein, partial [Paenibacillus nasutitermitis]|uniref:hypothetical protein n=1 Tax=Paenibacillus nasutitermitis TaxID=1652958 RepID=UPI001E5DE60E
APRHPPCALISLTSVVGLDVKSKDLAFSIHLDGWFECQIVRFGIQHPSSGGWFESEIIRSQSTSTLVQTSKGCFANFISSFQGAMTKQQALVGLYLIKVDVVCWWSQGGSNS